MLKKYLVKLIAIASIIVATSTFQVQAAVTSVGDSGRAWSVPNDYALGEHIQEFLDSFPGEKASWLVDNAKLLDPFLDPTCKSLKDESCNLSRINYQSVLPYCQSDSDLDCVVEFGIVDGNGSKTKAKFERNFPNVPQNAFVGDSLKNVPTGSTAGIFTLPKAAHDGGDKYFLEVTLNGGGDALTGAVSLQDFGLRLYPVNIEQSGYKCFSNCVDAGYALTTLANGDGKARWGHQGAGFSGDQYCVGNSMKEGLCAQRYAFPSGFTYYVSLRLKQLPSGWMHGRLEKPNIKIDTQKNYSLLEIQGEPLAVPVVYKKYKYQDMPAELKSQYDVKKGGYINSPGCQQQTSYCAGGRSGPSENPLNRNVMMIPDAWSKDGMEQLRLWLPFVGDKATALLSSWSVRTLSNEEKTGASSCFNDNSKLTGIVTTNSTQYSSGPPSFNAGTGSLEYQVASPHFGTTGDVFKGSYNLVMRSEVARCIYGFSKAPIKAEISVTSADGSPQIATTVVNEADGWLHLQANNFEFSAPTVTAKLTQDVVAVTKPASSTKKAVKSITCVKGKSTKKVTGDKCPTGYKRK